MIVLPFSSAISVVNNVCIMPALKVAIVGCVHGELDRVYHDIQESEAAKGEIIDLVLICGDFQTIRNVNDLKCMAVPQKYKSLGSFHEYYTGIKKAPYLTLFIGGNHEASNYLTTLPYGGWVAENIYYLGYSGIVNFGGLRISAISGIHKRHDAYSGHFEALPYDNGTIRSAYHTRALEVYRMIQINNQEDQQPVDIVMTHDWPLNIHSNGDVDYLLKRKPFFKQDISRNELGSALYQPLVPHLKPRYWFSAHLHVLFEASIDFGDNISTSFLALDKCLPKRPYFRIMDIEPKPEVANDEKVLRYDPEWLCVLRKTDKYVSHERNPRTKIPAIWITAEPVKQEEMDDVFQKFDGNLNVPYNFAMCPPVLSAYEDTDPHRTKNYTNPQTVEFCGKLGITDPISLIVSQSDPATLIIPELNPNLKPDVVVTETGFRKKLQLPEPVNATPGSKAIENPDEIIISDNEDDDEDVVELMTETTKKFKPANEEKEPTPLFFIDKKGQT